MDLYPKLFDWSELKKIKTHYTNYTKAPKRLYLPLELLRGESGPLPIWKKFYPIINEKTKIHIYHSEFNHAKLWKISECKRQNAK